MESTGAPGHPRIRAVAANFQVLAQALDSLNDRVDMNVPGAMEFRSLVDMVKNGIILTDQQGVAQTEAVQQLRNDIQQEVIMLNNRSANEFQRMQEHTGQLVDGMTNDIKMMKPDKRLAPIWETMLFEDSCKF